MSLADAQRERDPRARNDVEHLSRALVRDALGDDAAAAAGEAWTDALWRTLARYGGHRGATPTVIERSGDMCRLRRVGSARTRRASAVALQRQILTRAPEVVLEELDALAEREADAPFAGTYAGELLLWLGRYDEALARLDTIWQRTRTRWSYIGSGAALALLGRHDEALARWSAGERQFRGFLDAEATYAHRGDVYRARGELERARADLEHALRARPTRIGARVSLARTYGQLGRGRARDDEVRVIAEQAPALLWEAHKRIGRPPRVEPTAGDVDEVLAAAVTMLRGNRSSVVLTYHAHDGALRVHALGRGHVWREFAEHHLSALRDGLLEQVARDELA